jgi:gliding motility-associated-like protein
MKLKPIISIDFIMNKLLLVPRTLTILFVCVFISSQAQNSMVGDGFGGRLWYKPSNYTVGSYSAYTICGDSFQLYGWGSNTSGQLGDGTNNSTSSPVKATGMTNVRFYSTGYNMGAIKFDSTGWVWGRPLQNSPKKILDSVKFLDAGAHMCSFVKYDGTVWSVGRNNSSFGNGFIQNWTTDTPKMTLNINTAVRVANSAYNNIILLSNGTVMSVGSNGAGGLGNGTSNNTIALVPVQVAGLSKIIDIKSTATTNIALDSSGFVYAWGSGLGSGNGNPSTVFIPMKINKLSNIIAISGVNDGSTFLALDAFGNCYGWGYNGFGNIGDSSNINCPTPKLVARNVIDIMAGETFSYIVKANGTLWATGRSNSGSIWMNLKDSQRYEWTEINPTIAPLNLCISRNFSGNYFYTNTNHCVYDSIEFKLYQNDSFENHRWDFDDKTGIVYGKNPKHKFDSAKNYYVKLFADHKRTGATDTTIKVIDMYDVSNEKILGEDTMVCGRLAYTKNPKSYDEYYSYLWLNDNTSTFSKFINKSGEYIMKITDNHGCVYFDSFNVINHPLPKALFKADTYSMCLNSKKSIKFTNLSTSQDSIVRAVWDFTEDTLSSTDSVVHYKYKKADYYPVWLHVYTKYGCRGDTIDVFDILDAPKPKFELTILDSCINNNGIQLKNTTVPDSLQKPKFKWYFSEKYALSNTNPVGTRTYSDTGRYYIDLIYTYQNKCFDTTRQYVNIYPTPIPQIDVDSKICSSDSVFLQHSSSSQHMPLIIQWNIDNGTYTSIQNSLKYNFKTKGTHNLNLNVTDANGCSQSINKAISVYNPPIANFNINNSIQCLLNNSFTFNSLSSADSGILVSQKWSFGDNTFYKGIPAPPKSFALTGDYKVKLVVEDQFACFDSIEKFVYLKNGALANFNINDASQCENNQNFKFKYIKNSNNDSITSIEWRILSITYNNIDSISLSKFPVGKHPIELILNTQYGCPGLNSKNVIVNPAPKISFSVNTDTQCFVNHSFDITNNTSLSSGQIQSYFWTFDNSLNINNKDIANKTFANTGKHPFVLKVISDSSCIALDSGVLLLHPSPTIKIGVLNPICLGDSILFKNLSFIDGGSILTWKWNLDENKNSSQFEPKTVYQTAGMKNIVLTGISDKNCESNQTYNNWLKVNPLPLAKFSYKIEEGDKGDYLYKFKDESLPNPHKSYWDFGKFGKALRDSNISIIDSASINVFLKVTDSNTCENWVQGLVFATGPMQVYVPNVFTPNQDLLNELFIPGGVIFSDYFEFNIYNRWGEVLYKTTDASMGWDGTYNGQKCPDGVYVYLLKINDNNGKLKIYRGTFTLMR